MKNKGFSLVELIVVIAIMAILVGVAVPVYSSYIEKANAAKDEQLLGEINSAFAVVCAGNAIDINTVTEADIPVENGAVKLSTMVVKVGSTEIAGFAEAMVGILGNDLEFAVIEDIWYNKDVHKFVADEDVVFDFNGKEITISSKDLAILSGNNAFSNRGAEALLGDVGTLENLLATGIGAEVLDAVLGTEDFTYALGGYLGLTQGDGEDYDTYAARVEAALAACEDPDSALYSAEVMFAASQAANITDAQLDALFNGNGAVTSRIEVKADGETDYNATMANAALAYGMYTAYVQQYPDAENVDNFTLTINSPEFAAYYASAQGQADLEAYMAAMNMIGDNADNPEVASSILNNGITGNQELEDLMKEIMGN